MQFNFFLTIALKLLSLHLESRPWYRKKRFVIPLTLLTILVITGVITGSILGTRSVKTGTMFDILFVQKQMTVHFTRTHCSITRTFKDAGAVRSE